MATSKEEKALFPPPFLLRDFFPAKWRACSQVISLETAQCENHSFTSQEVGQTDNDMMFFFLHSYKTFWTQNSLASRLKVSKSYQTTLTPSNGWKNKTTLLANISLIKSLSEAEARNRLNDFVMQWVLNFCRTLKIPTLESWQKFKIIFLKNFSPVKSWSYGRLGWENPKRSGILLFRDLPRFGRTMKTRTRRHSRSSWMIDVPGAFEISAMVGDHSRQMKTQAYSVEEVGYRLAIVFWTVPISELRYSSLSSY